MSLINGDQVIEIAGAGPAGLAAAITLARAGCPVVVHEAQAEVGYRFKRDLQGIENWTTRKDALAVLADLAITIDFDHLACRKGTAFDAWGRAHAVRSDQPLFYMVERGPGPDTLDTALLKQAVALGVEVRFNSRLRQMHGPGILATGPKAADAIAVGYHFDTTMPDGFWVICDDRLAPRGYAYLLVMGGKGTVKSCMFTDFKREAVHVRRTVEAFRRRAGLEMLNPQPHGGVGNFRLPVTGYSGRRMVAGEQAGFQDTLWGFGIRVAINSGVLAAGALLEGGGYDARWRKTLQPLMAVSLVNRELYSLLGNRGYRWLLRRQEGRGEVRSLLHRHYRPTNFRRLLAPWARRRFRSRRRDESCNHVDCGCIWCRHGRQRHA